MAFCSFDDSAALFDATPVENMFITEYMLRAPGDFVKVYLYGLMLCYHHSERMSLASMARDLDMPEEDVERAYKYWERQGLVRKTGDNPIKFTYYNLKQITLTRAEKPSEQLYNHHFTEAVRQTLDQQELYPADYELIFDWVEQLELPEEVVIMLLETQKAKSKTGRLKLAYVDRVAREWAQNGIKTVEDVERIIVIGKEREQQLRRLLAQLGQRRMPSDEEKKMYNYWIDEWKCTLDDIRRAYEKTIHGVPTMNYMDGILRQEYQIKQKGIDLEQDQKEFKFAREIFVELGRTGVTPSLEDRKKIRTWIKDGFSPEMIKKAAREVHKPFLGGNLEDIQAKLMNWANKGYTINDVVDAEEKEKILDANLYRVYEVIGSKKRANLRDRDLLIKWQDTMKMSMDVILLAAEYSRKTGISMDIVDSIICEWYRANVHTVEEVQAYHSSHAQNANRNASTARSQDSLLRYTPEERKKTYSAAVLDFDEEDS